MKYYILIAKKKQCYHPKLKPRTEYSKLHQLQYPPVYAAAKPETKTKMLETCMKGRGGRRSVTPLHTCLRGEGMGGTTLIHETEHCFVCLFLLVE